MEFFTKYFKLEGESPSPQGEYTVLCPFNHKDRNGNVYKEENPSAHINEEKALFHCKSCGEGISEVAFVSKIEGIGYKEALSFLDSIKKSSQQDWNNSVEALSTSGPTLQIIKDLQISEVSEELQLGFTGQGVSFPVFVYGELLDIRSYVPDRKPKVMSSTGAKNLIIPFDLWRESESDFSVLCAGEKDMAITRKMGFNAFTFTGGEMSFPKLFKHSFKGKRIYIVYDNDQTGIEGAERAAYELKEAGADPRIVRGHYEVCTEKGEDVWDFFITYGKTADDFQKILDEATELQPTDFEKIRQNVYPRIHIEQASEGRYVDRRLVRTRVNTISVYEDMFSVPEYVQFEKYATGDSDTMDVDDEVEWMLDENNIEEILYLLDSNLTEQKRATALRKLAGIPHKEDFVRMTIRSTTNVFKSVVTDVSEQDVVASELLIYSVGTRMLAGKKYDMLYKPSAHPLDGMK